MARSLGLGLCAAVVLGLSSWLGAQSSQSVEKQCSPVPEISELKPLYDLVLKEVEGTRASSPVTLEKIKGDFQAHYKNSAVKINKVLETYNRKNPKKPVELVPESLGEFIRKVVEAAENFEGPVPIDPESILTLMWNETVPKGNILSSNKRDGGRGPFQFTGQTRVRYGLNTYNPVDEPAKFTPELWAKSAFNPIYAAKRAMKKWDDDRARLANLQVAFLDPNPNYGKKNPRDGKRDPRLFIPIVQDTYAPTVVHLTGADLEKGTARAFNEGPGYVELAIKRAYVYKLWKQREDPKYDLDITAIPVIEQFVFFGNIRRLSQLDEKKRKEELGATLDQLYREYDSLNLLVDENVPSRLFPKKKRLQYKGLGPSAITEAYLDNFWKSKDVFGGYIKELVKK